ncbi:SCO family protein [Thalassotalea ganghwensis]
MINKGKVLALWVFIALGVMLGLTLSELKLSELKLSELKSPNIETQAIELLQSPRRLSDFSLPSTIGDFTRQSLKGHWTIVLFGYLHCSDICPTSLMELAQLSQLLQPQLNQGKLQVVFVSVDANRDSLAEVEKYVGYFDSQFIAATTRQVDGLAESLAIQFSVVAAPQDKNYQVSHSINFSLINPKAEFVGRFRPGFDANKIALELSELLTLYSEL